VATLILFWLLDSYYLSRERRFVALYDAVRKKPGENSDFSMDISAPGNPWGWAACVASRTIALFYGGLLVLHLLVFHFL
jgi:hypothetical protein